MATATTAAPPTVGRVVARGLLAPVAPRTGVAVVHLVVDMVSAWFLATPILLMLVLTIGTLPFFPVSVAVFALLLVTSRLVGHVERFRIASLTGVQIANPHRREVGSWSRRTVGWVTSSATWKELGYHLLNLPVSILFGTVVVGVWSVALALVGLPLYVEASPAEQAHILGIEIRPGGPSVVAAGIGLVVLFVAPWLTRGLSRLRIGVDDGLLGGGEAAVLRRRVDTLEASRAQVVDAAEMERRRIERDLHDGAQQRLVALAMSLGLAKEKLDSDPEAARALVDEAHREAKHALVELRDLARGLHPPILTDRGLHAAVAGLASRAPVPVDVDVRLSRRPPPSIEGIAYFVISEALTNVARHSGATRARVVVTDTPRALVVEVSDDGIGGASADRGSGLRGLTDRAGAVDGSFLVTSPQGGPTVVRAELPLPGAGLLDPAPTPGPGGQ
jgi:signal transduction histidine kinase